MKTYDVIIIGAGSAGLSAQKKISQQTNNYLVIDQSPLGTTCARVGCMPSKAFLQTAHDYHRRLIFGDLGILGEETLTVDLPRILSQVRSLRDHFVASILKNMESWRDKHFIEGQAHFIAKDTIQVNGRSYKAKTFLIATGSSPHIPEPWKKFSTFTLTTDNFFEQKTLPQRMAVLGLGPIGIELGQAMSRLGVSVHGFTKGHKIGNITDPQITSQAIQTLSQEFSLCWDTPQIQQTQSGELTLTTGNTSCVVDKVLLATGRKPNLDTLGLKNLEIEWNDQGSPRLDENSLKIHKAPIWLIGDANQRQPLLHEANDEGSFVGEQCLKKNPPPFKRRTPLSIVFTQPNMATVGKTHQQLQKENINFVTGSVSFQNQGRAQLSRENQGALSLYIDQKTGHFLGAEIFAPAGEHLAHLLAWSLDQNATVSELLSRPYYHPVLEEGIRTALKDARKKMHTEKV
jgi:dihydrolipoamide dehydrogenase